MIYQQANAAYLMTLYGRATLPSMLTTRDRAHRRINILSRFFCCIHICLFREKTGKTGTQKSVMQSNTTNCADFCWLIKNLDQWFTNMDTSNRDGQREKKRVSNVNRKHKYAFTASIAIKKLSSNQLLLTKCVWIIQYQQVWAPL